MTVRELINELERFDGNAEVVISKSRYAFEIKKVKNSNINSCWSDDMLAAVVVSLGD